ncbi:MAG: T9SS type A sorting domain-containing protein, partial [Bacteroidota bacterium]
SFFSVQFTAFTGVDKGDYIQLKWSTVDEKKNRGFEVEKMNEDGEWIAIGAVEGSGTYPLEKVYTFEDNNPIPGANIYRLNAVDYFGKSEYTEPIKVNVGFGPLTPNINIYPNPVQETVTFENATGEVKISNSVGQIVKVVNIVDSKQQIDVSDFDQGIYFVQFQTLTQAVTKQFVKK